MFDASRVAALRRGLGLTASAAARKAEIHETQWRRCEAPGYNPGAEIIEKVAAVLGCPIDDLFRPPEAALAESPAGYETADDMLDSAAEMLQRAARIIAEAEAKIASARKR